MSHLNTSMPKIGSKKTVHNFSISKLHKILIMISKNTVQYSRLLKFSGSLWCADLSCINILSIKLQRKSPHQQFEDNMTTECSHNLMTIAHKPSWPIWTFITNSMMMSSHDYPPTSSAPNSIKCHIMKHLCNIHNLKLTLCCQLTGLYFWWFFLGQTRMVPSFVGEHLDPIN
jgi:hypothetical protein